MAQVVKRGLSFGLLNALAQGFPIIIARDAAAAKSTFGPFAPKHTASTLMGCGQERGTDI